MYIETGLNETKNKYRKAISVLDDRKEKLKMELIEAITVEKCSINLQGSTMSSKVRMVLEIKDELDEINMGIEANKKIVEFLESEENRKAVVDVFEEIINK